MEFLNNLMAPLDKSYCVYFFFTGLMALAVAAFSALTVIPCVLDKKKRHLCLNLLLLSFQMLSGYLVNRILYNLCIG